MADEVLNNNSKALKREYNRLFNLFNEDQPIDVLKWCTIREYVSECFRDISIRGTCLTLNDYDDEHGYNFTEYIPPNIDVLDYLISFCKYSYNLVSAVIKAKNLSVHSRLTECMKKPLNLYIEQVMAVIEKIGYMPIETDEKTEFVPKSPVVISVAEYQEPNLKDLTQRYLLPSLKGNMEEKGIILDRLGKKLEGYRAILSDFNADFENDLFCLLNSLDIRHNNTDESSKNFREFVANMEKEQLEEWYDSIYQMILLAFLIIESIKKHEEISKLRKELNKK